MKTILSEITEKIYDTDYENISQNELQEFKNAILDRIGCGLGALRLGLGSRLHKYIDYIGCTGTSTIWGTSKRAPVHLAALTNGAISSRLEYDTHDSMIPASLALVEKKPTSGKTLLESLKAGYITGVIIRRLLASSVEKRGLHWPAHLSGFSATSACATILNLSQEQTKNALGITASLNPVTPFEAFTKGAGVKDLYGGWGNMLGVQAALLSKSGVEGPDTIFEGKRGLFNNWLVESSRENILDLLDTTDLDVKFHFKPYPCCSNAHPTLTAIENILKENKIIGNITKVEIDTYRFGAELSKDSDINTPIGAKVNIPFLAASFLVYGKLLPEYSEYPWIINEKVIQLSSKIILNSSSILDELDSRYRSANVLITLENGETIEGNTDSSKWSNRVSQSEIEKKFRFLVDDMLPDSIVEDIINTVYRIENLNDLESFIKLLALKK